MFCPLCEGELKYKCDSVSDTLRRVYYCQNCPMMYLLMKDHEEEQVKGIQIPRREVSRWSKTKLST